MFTHGKLARVYVNGYDLSGYLRQTSITGQADVAEASVFGTDDKQYIPGMRDAQVRAGGLFDGDAAAVDEVLSAALGAERSVWVVWPQGDTHGLRGWGVECMVTRYEVNAPTDNVVDVAAEAQQSDTGYEGLVDLHALQAEAATASFGSVNQGGTTTSGWAAYVQITSNNGGTGSIVFEHATAGTGPYSALGTVTFGTAFPYAERISGAGSVNPWVRCRLATLGGGTVTFNAGLARK